MTLWNMRRVFEESYSGSNPLDPQDFDEVDEWSIVEDSEHSIEIIQSLESMLLNDDAKDEQDNWEVVSEDDQTRGSVGDSDIIFSSQSEPREINGKKTDQLDYVEHVVLPTDTLQGLCLAYRISATKLRMVNKFSGNSLTMAPSTLIIPLDHGDIESGKIRLQDKKSKEFKIHEIRSNVPELKYSEAESYIENEVNNIDEAICAARDDLQWKEFKKRDDASPQRFNMRVQQRNNKTGPSLSVTISVCKKASSLGDSVYISGEATNCV